MLTAFGEDKTSFRTRIMVLVAISAALLVSIFVMHQMYIGKLADNYKLAATYESQSDWLSRFDYREAALLEKEVLKPCKKEDVENIKQEQLNILRSHGLTLVSVRSGGAVADKKLNLNAVKTNVTVTGSWDNITAALNKFETRHLVVITSCEISPVVDEGGATGSNLAAKIEFATYHL